LKVGELFTPRSIKAGEHWQVGAHDYACLVVKCP